jgi:hypothetical protein
MSPLIFTGFEREVIGERVRDKIAAQGHLGRRPGSGRLSQPRQ